MTSKSRITLTVTFLVIAFVAPTEALEPVNLSRHVFYITVGLMQTNLVPISAATLDSFCRDQDGCTFSLRTEIGDLMRGRDARVYLAASGVVFTHWSTTLTTDVNFDDDDVTDFAGQVIVGQATCSVTDQEQLGVAGDTGPGFSLILGNISGFSEATCALVVFD